MRYLSREFVLPFFCRNIHNHLIFCFGLLLKANLHVAPKYINPRPGKMENGGQGWV